MQQNAVDSHFVAVNKSDDAASVDPFADEFFYGKLKRSSRSSRSRSLYIS